MPTSSWRRGPQSLILARQACFGAHDKASANRLKVDALRNSSRCPRASLPDAERLVAGPGRCPTLSGKKRGPCRTFVRKVLRGRKA